MDVPLIARRANQLRCFWTPLSSPLSKNISALQNQKSAYMSPRPVPQRGVAQRHETRGGMRWTQAAPKTRAFSSGRRSRVGLAPRRRRQVRGSRSAGDGDKPARSPGRARRNPLKPSACGNAGLFRCIRGDYARVVILISHARLRVHWAPGIPHALEGAKKQANLGRIPPRECGPMPQPSTYVSAVIASEAKQSSLSSLPRHGLLRFARNDGFQDLWLFENRTCGAEHTSPLPLAGEADELGAQLRAESGGWGKGPSIRAVCLAETPPPRPSPAKRGRGSSLPREASKNSKSRRSRRQNSSTLSARLGLSELDRRDGGF